MSRIKVFRKPTKILELTDLIIKKHEADGASSPINSINMADLKAKYLEAMEAYEAAHDAKREAEALFEQAYNALGLGKSTILQGSVRYYIMQARDILKGINRYNMHNLGLWGFTVDSSPQKKKEKKAI